MTISFSNVDYSFLSSLGLTFDESPTFNIGPEAGLIRLLNREEFIGNVGIVVRTIPLQDEKKIRSSKWL